MSRILEASCDASGKVTAQGIEVQGAILLCKGSESSDGVALFDKGQVYYIAETQSDLAEVIEMLFNILDQASTIMGAIDGATNAPAANAGAIAAMKADIAQFQMKGEKLR